MPYTVLIDSVGKESVTFHFKYIMSVLRGRHYKGDTFEFIGSPYTACITTKYSFFD